MKKSCLLNNSEEGTYNLLKNGQNIIDTSVIQTMDDIIAALDELNNLAIKERLDDQGDREYYFESSAGTHVFAHSASDPNKFGYERRTNLVQGKSKVRRVRSTEFMDVGTALHKAMERMTMFFFNNGTDADTAAFWDSFDLPDTTISIELGSSIRERDLVREQIEAMAKGLLADAQANQDKINSKTGRNDKFHVRFEQTLVNPPKDMVGHQDLLILFSDKTVWDFDYKTKGVHYTSGRKNQLTERLIRGGQLEDNTAQMHNYKDAKGMLPIKVTRSIIVPIVYKAQRATKDGKVEKVSIKSLYIGTNNKASTPIATAFSETTNEEVNKVIRNLNTRYTNLVKAGWKIKNDPNAREFIMRKAERLFEVMQALALAQNTETLMDNVSAIFNLTVGDSTELENMEYAQLEKMLEDVQLLKTLQDVFGKMLAEEESYDPKLQDDKLIAGLKRARALYYNSYDQRLDVLEAALISEKVKRVLGNIDERFTEKTGSAPLLKMRDLTFFERWLVAYDYIDNPLIQRVSELNLIQQRKALTDYRARSKQLIDKANAFFTYANNTWGYSQNQAQNMLIDWETGRMVTEIDGAIFTDLADAIQREDLKWIQDNFVIEDEDEYLKKYQKREDAHRKALIREAGGNEDAKTDDEIFSKDDTKREKKLKTINRELGNFRVKNNLVTSKKQAWLDFRNVKFNTKIRETTRESYKTKEYKLLEQHPPAMEYYHELKSLYTEMRDILGLEASELPSNFIPAFKSSLIDKVSMAMLNSNQGMDDIKEWLKDTLNQNEIDKIEYQQGEEQGWTEGAIPIVGMQYLPPKQKSPDLMTSALIFMKSAYLHRYLEESVSEARAIMEMVKPGSKTMDQYIQITNQKDNQEATAIYKVLESMIGYQWYGRRYRDIGEGQGKIPPRVAKVMNTARNYHILTKMGFNFVSAAGAGIGALTRASFLARAGVAYNKEQFRSSLKGYANAEDRSQMIMMAHYFDTSAEGQVRRDIRTQTHGFRKTKSYKGARKWLREEGLMYPWSLGDDKLSHIVTAAVSKNYGIDEDGNIRRIDLLRKKDPEAKSIWELIEVDNLKGDIKFAGQENDDIIQDHTWQQFHKAVRQTMINVIGQLNERELMGLQSTIVGTMFTTYRTWVPGVLMGEFGGLQYDYAFRTIKEGRLNSVWKNYAGKGDAEEAVFTNMLKSIPKFIRDFLMDSTIYIGKSGVADGTINREKAEFQFNQWKALNPDLAIKLGKDQEEQLDHWIDMKERNLNAAFAEIRIVAAMGIIALIAASLDFNDDEVPDYKEYLVTRQLFRLYNKMTTEVSTPLSLKELASTTNPQVPTYSLVMSTLGIAANTLDEGRDLLLGEDSNRDRSPIFYKTRKEIPVINAFFKIFDNIYKTDIQSDPLLRR